MHTVLTAESIIATLLYTLHTKFMFTSTKIKKSCFDLLFRQINRNIFVYLPAIINYYVQLPTAIAKLQYNSATCVFYNLI